LFLLFPIQESSLESSFVSFYTFAFGNFCKNRRMSKIIIAASNLNMARRDAVFGDAEAHQEFLENGGYKQGAELGGSQAAYTGGGFEWSDIRNIHNLRRDGNIALRLAAGGDISALHQSWRSTTIPSDILPRFLLPKRDWLGVPNTFRNNVEAVGRAAVIPLMSGSLERLAPIQEAAGRRLPVTAHPNQQQPPGRPGVEIDYRLEADQFTEIRHQPTVDTLRAWRVLSDDPEQTVEDMIGAQQNHGFSSVAWDTHHAQEERYGYSLSDPEAMVGRLGELGRLGSIQINLTLDAPSLKKAVDGNLHKTPHGRMLETVADSLPEDQTLNIVTEVAADSFGRIGIQNEALGNRMLVEAIVETTQM
jgi:hypothetical protein